MKTTVIKQNDQLLIEVSCEVYHKNNKRVIITDQDIETFLINNNFKGYTPYGDNPQIDNKHGTNKGNFVFIKNKVDRGKRSVVQSSSKKTISKKKLV